MSKQTIKQGYAQAYGNAFGISQENIDLLKELFIMKKWISKEETSYRLAIKKLSEFTPEFQTVLIENAIAGGYQGLVFANSKQEEQNYYGKRQNTKPFEQHKEERNGLAELSRAILANRNL